MSICHLSQWGKRRFFIISFSFSRIRCKQRNGLFGNSIVLKRLSHFVYKFKLLLFSWPPDEVYRRKSVKVIHFWDTTSALHVLWLLLWLNMRIQRIGEKIRYILDCFTFAVQLTPKSMNKTLLKFDVYI